MSAGRELPSFSVGRPEEWPWLAPILAKRASIFLSWLMMKEGGEDGLAQDVRRARDGSEEDLRAFLTSNELWGGAGSIADQAGVAHGVDARRRIEQALISLGTLQIEQGVVNARTEMWLNAFSKWM